MNIRSWRFLIWVVFLLMLGLLLTRLDRSRTLTSPPPSETSTPAPTPSSVVTPIMEATEEVVLTEKQKRVLDQKEYSNAITEGGEAACDKIQYDPELKATCLDGLRFTKIISRRNTRDCSVLLNEGTRQFCVNKIHYLNALDKWDLDLCKAIKDDALQTNCLDQINLLLHPGAQTLAGCKGLQTSEYQATCFDQYYYEAAVNNASPNDCDQVKDPVLQERCKGTLTMKEAERTQREMEKAKVVANSPRAPLTADEKLEPCNLLSGDEKIGCRDKVNFDLAFEKKELAFCNRIAATELKNKCLNDQGNTINGYYLRLALAGKDATLCQKITDMELRTTCLNFSKK